MNYASCLAESLAGERDEARRAVCRVTGAEGLMQTVAEGQGAILVTAHVGPWEVAARLLAGKLDTEVMIAMLAEADAGARELHDQVRARNGVRVAHVGQHPLDSLPLLKHVRSGGVAAFQLDRQAPGGRTAEVQCFGESVAVPLGPFMMAAATGVEVVPCFACRVGFLEYELMIGQGARLSRGASNEELSAAAQSLTQQMADFIQLHPTQWFDFEPERAAGYSAET
jgi:KDO2-lipid IV(A) lauroyltransferase